MTTQNLKIFTINTLTKTSVRDHRLITPRYKVHFYKLIKTTIYKNEKEPQKVQASPTEDLYIANKNTKRWSTANENSHGHQWQHTKR